MKTLLLVVLVFWSLNEILQHNFDLDIIFIDVLVNHLSSFYGAIVVIAIFETFQFNRYLFVLPVIAEFVYDLILFGTVDYFDYSFSLLGILISYTILKYHNQNS